MNETREYTLTALFFVCFAFITGVIVIVAINAPLQAWLIKQHIAPGLIELATIGVMALWAFIVVTVTNAFYKRYVTVEDKKNATIIVLILLVLAGCLMWYLIGTDGYIIKPLLHKTIIH
ncbi:MAG: hypothetical protein ACM3PP_03345 [Candidatus Saccharibacteria bacterium]